MAFSIVFLLAGSVFAQTGGTYDLSWNTVDGGGGTVTGGTYSLSFTVGQHDAGQVTGGTYALRGGYWAAAAAVSEGDSPLPAPPPHNILKNRYISIDPRGAGGINVGKNLDIRLTLSTTLVNGVTALGSVWWANAPDANCISIVGPTQPGTPPNWDACPTLHMTGCPIIPTSSYDIVVIDGAVVSDPPLATGTQTLPLDSKWWGDAVGTFTGDKGTPPNVWTPPQGVTNFDDVNASLKTFINPAAVNATHTSITDIHPNQPTLPPPANQINKLVNIDDVFNFIKAFQGDEYPGPEIHLCTDP